MKVGDVDTYIGRKDFPRLLARLPQSHRDASQARSYILYVKADSINDILKRAGERVEKGEKTAGFYDMETRTIHVSSAPALYLFDTRNPTAYLRRSARVGTVMTFYHEYAHSLRGEGITMWISSWDVLQREWRSRHDGFAEAYAFYATSKISRMRLKGKRPISYDFMKRFFKEEEER